VGGQWLRNTWPGAGRPEASDLLEGLELFGNTMIAPLRDAEQAVRLGKTLGIIAAAL
jgi:hypothetical protein